MLYQLIKFPIKWALRIFCTDMFITHPDRLKLEGPLLLVANHPNSFLDAIIIASQCKHPVHFLARGDAFHKPWHNSLLGWLNMIPIYRISEGKENLHLNEKAFNDSFSVLKKGGIVLIFIEGISVHSNQLMPFKKGAARIALFCLREKIALNILPITLTYHSFEHFGKKVLINPLSPTAASTLFPKTDDATNMLHFNQVLYAQMQEAMQPGLAPSKVPSALVVFLGHIGKYLHLPLYRSIKRRVVQKTKATVFYDSVMFGVLLFAYPVYLLLLGIFLTIFGIPVSITAMILILHPLTAYAAARVNLTYK